MKSKSKIGIKLIAAMLIIAFVAAVCAGCGGAKKPETVEEFLADNADTLAELQSFAVGNGLTELKVEGNRIAFIYEYEEEFTDEQRQRIAARIDDGLGRNLSDFAGLASRMNATLEINDTVVAIVYRDGAGREILTKEFTAPKADGGDVE